MTFKEWISMRQDARTWTEDELAVAELVWNSAVQITDGKWSVSNRASAARIANLERENSWLEHENWNLKNMTGESK